MDTNRAEVGRPVATPVGDDRWSSLSMRLRDLANGMVILAVVGLVYFLWVHAHDFQALRDVSRLLPREPDLIFARIEPMEFARVGWPLGVAIAFRVLRWPRLARAAAVTFLVLAADRFLGAVLASEAIWTPAFLTRVRALRQPGPLSQKFLITLSAGLVLMVWAATLGVRGLLVDRSYRRLVGRIVEPGGRRRWTIGRLAVLASLVFGLGLFLGRAWEVYDEVLVALPELRRMILRGTRPAPPAPYYRMRRVDPALVELAELLRKESDLHSRGQYREFSRIFPMLLDRFQSYTRSKPVVFYQADLAMSANNLAWAMATSPDERGRSEPRRAVELARAAVNLVPHDGNTWNTLAVAHFRAGDRDNAYNAFAKAMELRVGGDSFDWFFLAMLEQQSGRPDKARQWYDRAVNWMKSKSPQNSELYRFRAEAATCLVLDDPEAFGPAPEPPPPPPQRRRGGGFSRPLRPD